MEPAATTLGRGGTPVTVVARRARDDAVAQISAAAVDAADVPALEAALDAAVAARGPFTLALVYAPFAPATAQAAIARRVPGVLVHVLTSRWAAPDVEREQRDAWAPDGAGLTRRLTLGWAVEPDGAVRWHTPREVSAAALWAARSAHAERALGALRPWEDRPE